MSSFQFANKNILLGISGSIAAYKACELLRSFQDGGATTRAIMTQQATEFITPLTLQALSGNEVRIGLTDYAEERAMGHINLARWADLLVIAPASAALLVRLAAGDASDLLSAVFLATTSPRLIAPAMNKEMWAKQQTQANIAELKQLPDTHIVQPGEGWQACGEIGAGRLADLNSILNRAASIFEIGALNGKRLLITAGPTREPLDEMRFLSNRSSGKMGYALAAASVEAGAHTTLISGPVHLSPPDHCELIQVETAAQMLEACINQANRTDVFIGAAAVADMRPAQPAKGKPPKDKLANNLKLHINDDILIKMRELLPPEAKTIGFAAEVEDLESLEKRALTKLKSKKVDMLCANNLNQAYGADENEVLLLFNDGRRSQLLKRASKRTIAHQILQQVASLCESN